MPRPEINDAHHGFQGGNGKLAEVAVVGQDDTSLGVSQPQEGEIAGTRQATFFDVQDVETETPKRGDQIRMKVLIRQEGEILQPQPRISALITTSFSRKRDAYRIACSTSSAVRWG